MAPDRQGFDQGELLEGEPAGDVQLARRKKLVKMQAIFRLACVNTLPTAGWCVGYGFIVAMVVVIVGVLAGGPVGRFKVVASRDGAILETEARP